METPTTQKVRLTGLQIFTQLVEHPTKLVYAKGVSQSLEHLKNRLASLGVKAEMKTHRNEGYLEIDMASVPDTTLFKATHLVVSDEFPNLEVATTKSALFP